MYRECGGVQYPIAFDDATVVVYAQEVGRADVTEVHAVRIHPESVRVLGIASGDVAGYAPVKAMHREDPECGSEVLFPVHSLFLGRTEHRRVGEDHSGWSDAGIKLCHGSLPW